MADCKIARVYTGIAGSHIKSFNSRGMVAIKDKEVSALDVQRVIETARAMPIPDRPADPAHPDPGIRHRRPGRHARADRHERRAPGSEGAHRHRRGVGGPEHRQVRAPLRPGSERSDPAAAGVLDRRADRGRKGTGRVPGGHRRRHHRHRDFSRGRDPAYRGDPDRRRPDHQRHRDGAAHAHGRGRGNQDPQAAARCASSPTPTS